MLTDIKNAIERLYSITEHGSIDENESNVTLSGSRGSLEIFNAFSIFKNACLLINYEPVLDVNGDSVELADYDSWLASLDESSANSYSWRILVSKQTLLSKVESLNSSVTYKIFFSENAFKIWAEKLCDFNKPLWAKDQSITVLLGTLKNAFGGEKLKIFPIEGFEPASEKTESVKNIPSTDDVHKIIHSHGIMVSPLSVSLSWGDLSQSEAKTFLKLYALHLAASLVNDLYFDSTKNQIQVVLRGIKRIEVPLYTQEAAVDVDEKHIELLADAVKWVYEEKQDTRHNLIVDRLSIEIVKGESLLDSILKHIEVALRQAKEKYVFVIEERKDAYYKELRDILKDVRTQADLYAAKIRELTNTLLRDLLALLILIGVGLIAKFDSNTLATIAVSPEAKLFFRVMSVYFIFSIALQSFSHLRDLSLASSEAKSWMRLVYNYTSEQDIRERFELPIERRKKFFNFIFVIILITYLVLAWVSWNFQSILCRIVNT